MFCIKRVQFTTGYTISIFIYINKNTFLYTFLTENYVQTIIAKSTFVRL